MKIILIAAIGKKNEIGLENKLLWQSKSDLESFKNMTEGYPILMGRKTFESLPCVLPNREHYVVSTKDGFCHKDVTQVSRLEDALDLIKATHAEKVFVIGGASVYEQTLNIADKLVITHMDWIGKADTFFPKIDDSIWEVSSTVRRYPTKLDPITWRRKVYKRK